MVGKTIHYCNRCDYKSNRGWDVKRHFSKMHTNWTSSAVERSHQFPLQQPSQQSLPNIHVPMQKPVGSGQNEVAYSDEDTNFLWKNLKIYCLGGLGVEKPQNNQNMPKLGHYLPFEQKIQKWIFFCGKT